MAALETGELVDGRFEVEFCAGSGGMGRVYRCRDATDGASVALKVMTVVSAASRERFAREVRVLAELRHPCVVRYIAHGVLADGAPYLVMEWIDGEPLGARVCGEPLSVRQAVSLLRKLCDALSEAHSRGIVHRDIKPANIMLRDRKLEAPKVLDFGLARAIDTSHAITRTGTMIGTPAYMAPEQAQRGHCLDPRSDVFALGCVLFECLSGYPAFRGPNLVSVLCKVLLEEPPWLGDVRGDAPDELSHLVASMLAKDPANRPADANAVCEALDRIDLDGSAGPRQRDALGGEEQRYLSVILAGCPAQGDAADLPTTLGSPRLLLGIGKAADTFDAELCQLVDNTVMVTLRGAGDAADRAARAARCALAVRDLMPHVPVVLATGRGVLKARQLVGDAIDSAAKLLQLANRAPLDTDDGGPVLADRVTASLLDVRFDMKPREDRVELLAYRARSVEPRKLLGRHTPCVGRTRELTTLRAVWDECCEGAAQAVVVTGPPGIGKTRLLREWVSEVGGDDPDCRVLAVRADPMCTGGAFGMLARLVCAAANVRDDDPPQIVRERIEACVSRHVPSQDAPRVSEFLADMVGAPYPEDDSVRRRAARHDPVLRGDQIRLALQDWLLAETRAQPMLVVLEDLQWGDATTVDWMSGVLRTLRDQPLCVVALGRPQLEERFPRLWADREVTTFTLGPLRMRAAVRLVNAALDGVDAETAERIAKRSGGNPFFLEELVRAEAEGRSARAPDTVLAILQARLEDLASSSRLVLRAASVFGDRFAQAGIRTLLSDDLQTLDASLQSLVEREIVVALSHEEAAQGDEFAFAQGLWREASYATLTDSDRRLGHGLAAAWLERERPGEAFAIAEHYELGGVPWRAGQWFAVAARHALEGGDYVAALSRSERGQRCDVEEVRGELLLVQAEAHKWRGENSLAAERALSAMERLPTGTRGFYVACGEAAAALGKLGESERLAELAQTLRDAPRSQALSAPARAIALSRSATQLVLAGRLDAADELLDLLSRDDVDPAIAGWVFEARAVRAGSNRNPESRVALAQAAAACFTEAGDARNACLQLTSAGFALNEIGSYAQAQAALQEAVALAERLGLSNASVTAQAQLGRAMARAGEHRAAEDMLRSAAAQLSAQGNARLEGVARTYLAALLLETSRLELAEEEARRAVVGLAKVPPLKAGANAQLAQVLLAAGRPAEAYELAREAAQIFDAAGSLATGEGLVRLLHVETLFATGRHAEGRLEVSHAHAELKRKALQITQPEQRAAFEQVREHARTHELFGELVGGEQVASSAG